MSEPIQTPPPRSYGCSFGCGNPYDYVVISCADATTEFLCLPCYVRLATDMIAAVTDSDDPKVKAALAESTSFEVAPMTGDSAKARGHNAPVGAEDDDLLTAYDGVVTVDDLPDEFK